MKIVFRDLELMRWILEQKFMTREQIRKEFWRDESKKSIEEYRTLNELESAKLLRRSTESFYRCILYLVTGRGVSLLRSFGKDQGLSELPEVSYSNYKHDVAVTDLRILFDQWGYKDWVSERVLSKINDLRYLPDGMIHHRGRNIAIEYESTLKSTNRYRDIFLHYALERKVDTVLYIVASEKMIEKMSNQKFRNKIHFVTLQNLQTQELSAQLKGISGLCSVQEVMGGNV